MKPKSHISCSQECVRKWTSTPPNELPFWKLESWWIFEFLKSNYRGQNPLNWGVIYVIKKILEHGCLKWARITHLGYLKHKLWPKEGLGVKLPIWLSTTKSWESPQFPYMQVACHIPWESSQQGLQLCLNLTNPKLHLNRRSAHKVMGLQSRRNFNFGNFGTPKLESWNKMTFGCWSCVQAQKIL
jgi:hypothetical protein